VIVNEAGIDFQETIQGNTPPAGTSLALQAMWYDANGNWDEAHRKDQEQDDRIGAWVHAYLRRVEGDEFNPGYWYRKAGRPHSQATLAESGMRSWLSFVSGVV